MSTHHRSLAFHRLTYEDAAKVNNGIIEFMQSLCVLEEELLDLETRVTGQEIDLTGWEASKDLKKLEAEHNSFVQEIENGYQASVTGHLTRLDRYEGEKHSSRTQRKVPDYRTDFLRMISHLQHLADRIGRRIDAKRNSANSRLVLSASALAAAIALVSLTVSVVSLASRLIL